MRTLQPRKGGSHGQDNCSGTSDRLWQFLPGDRLEDGLTMGYPMVRLWIGSCGPGWLHACQNSKQQLNLTLTRSKGGDTMTDSCNILPGCKGLPKFTLSLKRDKVTRLWSAPLVCSGCRKSLEREMRTQGKTLQFFSLEGSKREAEKRNAESQSLRVFLLDFAKPAVKAELKKFSAKTAASANP